VPSLNLATTTPDPNRPLPRKPTLNTVKIARPLALARIEGGIILSGPNACEGSMKDARIRPHFLHSPGRTVLVYDFCISQPSRQRFRQLRSTRAVVGSGTYFA